MPQKHIIMDKPLKIVYITPQLYTADGVARVLTMKANYFAEKFNYDITIILTEGKDKPLFYQLSDKIHVVNLDLNFEEMWHQSFFKKTLIYLKKQRKFKYLLTRELMQLRPDISVTLLRREINFINEIKDGSKKIGELHVNRDNYRNFEQIDANMLKNLFAKFWMKNLVSHLKRLDKFIILTEEDRHNWEELDNVAIIPNPLPFTPKAISPLSEKRVIAVGRYVYQKGFDLLLKAWAIVEKTCPEWTLVIMGDGNRSEYEGLVDELHIDKTRCKLLGRTEHIQDEYIKSSILVMSSRFEGFGMVLVEAMACGIPVVSFECPCGPKDIIKDRIDGILVENGNVEKLAEAMIWTIQHPEQLEVMSQNALNNVKRFNIDKIANQWKQLFEEIVQKK